MRLAGCGAPRIIPLVIGKGRTMRRRNNRGLHMLPGYPQLVPNANVEAGVSAPDSWFHSLSGTEWPAGEGHTGSRSLRINVTNDMADWRSSPVAIVGGRKYRVGMWVRGLGSSEMILSVRWFSDADGANWITEQWIPLNATYADWTPIYRTLLTPANARSGDLMFRTAFATTADIYGDNFSVRRVN